MLPEWFPETHQDSAERIRSYLIGVRGGAPFLSGADCRLLVHWLDDQVPEPVILSAIDRVSLRRRAKRVRTRLSLNSCKGEVNRILNKSTVSVIAKEPSIIQEQNANGLATLLLKIDKSLRPHSIFINEQRTLLIALQPLTIDQRSIQEIANDAISLISDFHQLVWDESFDQHEVLTQQAEEELSDLQSLLPPIRWQEAVEEVARDRLRAQFPLLSAQMIWNSLNQVLK